MNELQNPRREVLHDLQKPVKQLQMNDSTKLLQEASSQDLSKAYVQLGGGEPRNDPKIMKTAALDFVHPLNSKSHTDSAGGEAFENELHQQESRPPISPIDQDEPQVAEAPQNSLQKRMSTNDSDMQVFDDPTIQNNPNKTSHKIHVGGLPPGLPMGPTP